MPVLERMADLHGTAHVAGVQFRCGDCGQVKDVGTSCGTGYGYYSAAPDAVPVCYSCCGERDKRAMVETGRATLYLNDRTDGTAGEVTNWPGSLRFRVTGRRSGSHNIARHRVDVWFRGPDGKEWHGVQLGRDTQICRCKRLKG